MLYVLSKVSNPESSRALQNFQTQCGTCEAEHGISYHQESRDYILGKTEII